MLAVCKLTGDFSENIMPKAPSNLKFPHQIQNKPLQKGRNSSRQRREFFLFQQCERRTKKLIWELGISEEYIHNLEKKKQRSRISMEFCLFILSIKKTHKSSPQQKKMKNPSCCLGTDGKVWTRYMALHKLFPVTYGQLSESPQFQSQLTEVTVSLKI